MTVPVGASAAAIVIVDVPRPLVFGRPVDHHVEVTHRVSGDESDPKPQRVTFQQRPWLPWWVPPAAALLAAFITVLLMLSHHPAAPDLTGRTVANATKLLKRHDLEIGRTTYETAPKGVPTGTIISQVPEAGAEDEGERVDIALAGPAEDRARAVGERAHAGPGGRTRSRPRTSQTARSRPARETTGS